MTTWSQPHGKTTACWNVDHSTSITFNSFVLAVQAERNLATQTYLRRTGATAKFRNGIVLIPPQKTDILSKMVHCAIFQRVGEGQIVHIGKIKYRRWR